MSFQNKKILPPSQAEVPKRQAIELELMANLDEDALSDLCCQFPVPCDYDGTGSMGSKFVFYL